MTAQPDRPVRRAGSPWRILVHEWLGTRSETGLPYGKAHHVTSREGFGGKTEPSDDQTVTILEGTEFDELVIGRWIHLEQMDSGLWWINLAGVTIHVRADRDGRPKRIDVCGPGDYDDAVEGCRYSLAWSRPEEEM